MNDRSISRLDSIGTSRALLRLLLPAISVLAISFPVTAQSGPDEILLQYDDVDAVTLEGTVIMHVQEELEVCEVVDPTVEMAGTFKYYADGNNVRLDSHIAQGLYPGLDTVVAFDGEHFQYLARDSGILTLETATSVPTDEGMMTLPNPLYQLIQHVAPVTSANPGAPVQWSQIKSVAASSTMQNATWTTVVVDGRTLERAIVAGGTNDGIAYSHHVFVRPGQRGRPIQIDRVSDQGAVITRAKFEHYQQIPDGASGHMWWPLSAHFELRNPATGTVAAELSILINKLVLNDASQLPSGIFEISWTEANTVIVNGVVVLDLP